MLSRIQVQVSSVTDISEWSGDSYSNR